MASSRSGSPVFVLLVIAAVIIGANAKPPNRIFGGQLAPENQFRAAVSLSYPGNTVHTCGGGIISPYHILTAAHCVETRSIWEISVRAGCDDLRDDSTVIERGVTDVFMHPKYLSFIEGIRAVKDDIAILVLDKPLPIGGRILAFKLPLGPAQEGFDFHLAGWGINLPNAVNTQYKLKTLVMAVGDSSGCDNTPRTFCAYSKLGTACPGDSGSPLAWHEYMYGIASTSRCTFDSPVTFVNVYDYVGWINQTISRYPRF